MSSIYSRTRTKQDYVPHVLRAVKVLSQGKDNGASRQTIEKYLEGAWSKETNEVIKLSSPVVKSAIREALNSGLLVHASGVGLNGSFMLPQKSIALLRVNSHDKKKTVITKKAKLRNISSLAREFDQDTPPAENTPKRSDSKKRKRNTKLVIPFAEGEMVKKSKPLKTILKSPRKRKFTCGSRKVKFCSPPRVIFISPCIKRRSKRKK